MLMRMLTFFFKFPVYFINSFQAVDGNIRLYCCPVGGTKDKFKAFEVFSLYDKSTSVHLNIKKMLFNDY